MQDQEVMTRLKVVFSDIFDEEMDLAEATTANDIEEWDSLTHVSLVVAIEKEFGIRFGTGEVEKAKNVGELKSLIQQYVTQ
jgi:acyl carrier protein